MTTNHHTAISTGAAANASTFNSRLSDLDSRLTEIDTSIDTDGTLKAGAVDVSAVLADNVVTAAKIADNVVGSTYNAGSDLTLEAASDEIVAARGTSASLNDRLGGFQGAGILFDTYNQYTTPNTNWGSGKARWRNGSYLSIVNPDSSNPYNPDGLAGGARTMRFSYQASPTFAGKKIWLDEVGLKPGDQVTFAVLVSGSAGTCWLASRVYKADDSTASASQQNGANTVTLSSTPQIAYNTLTIPDASTEPAVIHLYVTRLSGTAAIDIYAWWATRGSSAGTSPVPDVTKEYLHQEIVDSRGSLTSLTARLAVSLNTDGTLKATSVTFPSGSDTYGRYLLRSWQGQAAKITRGEAEEAVIAVIGDSWVNNNRIVGPLAGWLQTEYGDAGPGWCSVYSGHTAPNGITRTITGTWTDSDQQATSRGVDAAHSSTSDTATPAKQQFVGTYTDAVIHYIENSGAGSFRWRVDGGSWTTVSTAAGSEAHATTTISGLSAASHTLEVELVSGTITMLGIDFQESGGGVRVHKVGNSGARADHYTALSSTIWSAGLTALAPDLCILLLGTNDDSADVVPATFNGHMDTICDRIQAALPLCDILILTPAANGLAAGTYAMSAYVEQLRTVAVDQNAACLDLYLNINDYTAGNSRGLYADTSHLSAQGGELAANLLIRMLRVQ